MISEKLTGQNLTLLLVVMVNVMKNGFVPRKKHGMMENG